MRFATTAVLVAGAVVSLSCASNEELQQRMDKRNENYSNYNERRKIRTEARQERTDMWYERHMD